MTYPGTNVVMGNASSNNALVVSTNANTIKGFRPEPNVLHTSIEGPYSGIAYHMYTFESVASCGSAPYTYQWRVSTDGFNYGSVIGTGEFFNTHLYHSSSSNWHYIKLTVTSADNQTSNSFHQVWVEDNPYRLGVPENEVVENVGIPFINGQLYPNPVVATAHTDVEMTSSGRVSIDILGTDGARKANVLNRTLEQGKHHLAVPFHKYALSDGLYIIRVQTPEYVKTHKVLYHHEGN